MFCVTVNKSLIYNIDVVKNRPDISHPIYHKSPKQRKIYQLKEKPYWINTLVVL